MNEILYAKLAEGAELASRLSLLFQDPAVKRALQQYTGTPGKSNGNASSVPRFVQSMVKIPTSGRKVGPVGRTADVLRCLAKGPMLVDDICRQTGLAKKPVQRTLSYLRQKGYVESYPDLHFVLRSYYVLTPLGWKKAALFVQLPAPVSKEAIN